MQSRAPGASRDDTHSLAPIQLESTSFDRDLASIKRGQGKHLVFALLATTLVMAGTLQWMGSTDGRRAYATAATQLEALHTEHLAAFEHCALVNTQHVGKSTRGSIEIASDQFRKAYGARLAPCSEALVVFERELAALDFPMKMEHRIDGLSRSAHALARAIGGYRSYLQDPKSAYDPITAAPLIEKVAVAWTHFDRQHQSAIDALRKSAEPR